MILRRLTEYIRTQNWTAIGIDFVIVVVGVFVGIQLGNWNQARADQRLGREYQQRLIADLQDNFSSIETLYTYFSGVLESVEETDRLLAAPDPDPVALITAAYRSSEFTRPPLQRSTWDEIVSAGHIDLLPSTSREAGLFDYYSGSEVSSALLLDLSQAPYRQAVRSVIPIAVQAQLRERCSDVIDERGLPKDLAAGCTLDLDPEVLRQTRDALIASSTIRETLRYQYSMVRMVQTNNVAGRMMLKRLINDLGDAGTSEGKGDE